MNRIESRLAAAALACVVLTVTACGGSSAPDGVATSDSAEGWAGSVNGEPITNADLIEILSDQQYDLLRSAVKAIATNRLLDQ